MLTQHEFDRMLMVIRRSKRFTKLMDRVDAFEESPESYSDSERKELILEVAQAATELAESVGNN